MTRLEVVVRPVGHDERAALDPLWAGLFKFYKADGPRGLGLGRALIEAV